MIDETRLEEYFRYHPPKTEERKSRHEKINRLAYEFTKALSDSIEDFELKQKFFYDIQFMRMMANQEITMNEVLKNE